MPAREPELEGNIFSDKDGKPYEGQRFIMIPNDDTPTGYISTEVNYSAGKIHGSPAIVYPDGLEETWEDGKFVAILYPPYQQRE